MKKILYLVALIAIFSWSIPFVSAWAAGGNDWIFNGFLLNPADGNSYLAKMQIGWRGEWIFTLPYSAEQGSGAYLFLFYIGLGHISRFLGVPIPLMFHLARLMACLLLLWTLWKFIIWLFGEKSDLAAKYYPLIVFGSGLGWLISPFLGMTSDFWVAEAYPFLSGYANPHFPLGISLILWIFIQSTWKITYITRLLLTVEGLLLSVIMPFGIAVIGVVLVGSVVWDWIIEKQLSVERLIWPLGAGGIFLLYQVLAIQSDPILTLWNNQNITPSPAWWDLLVSFSPVLILAVIGLWFLRKNELNLPWRMMIVWLVLGLALIYFPFSLQRRFLTAYFIPVCMIGVAGLLQLKGIWKNRIFYEIVMIASVLTNVIVLASCWFGIQTLNQSLFISKYENEAMIWLDEHAVADSLVTSSPQIGLFIPARTSLRVIYGHPFETANAENEREFIDNIFKSEGDPNQIIEKLKSRSVDYVFWGMREKELGKPLFINQLHIAFENPQVTIFQIPP